MAKRVPPGEKPYRPVDDALVLSVLTHEPRKASDPGATVATGIVVPAQPVATGTAGGQGASPGVTGNLNLERMSREKRLLLTPSEEREVERLVADLAAHLKTPLKTSHVLRATVTLLRHAGDELLRQSQRVGPLRRPPNNDAPALAAFEHFLARVIDGAVRSTRPLE